jgi:hypothetical protein
VLDTLILNLNNSFNNSILLENIVPISNTINEFFINNKYNYILNNNLNENLILKFKHIQ